MSKLLDRVCEFHKENCDECEARDYCAGVEVRCIELFKEEKQ